MKAGTASLVPALFGDKASGLVSALASMSGVKSSSRPACWRWSCR